VSSAVSIDKTYNRPNYPTHCSRVFPTKPTVPQLIKNFPAFHGTRRFITAFTNARHLSISSARSKTHERIYYILACVRAYVCMYERMYTRVYVCMYVCMNVCTRVCMYVCMHVCMYLYMYVCTYVCMYVCMNVCTRVCVCMYV